MGSRGGLLWNFGSCIQKSMKSRLKKQGDTISSKLVITYLEGNRGERLLNEHLKLYIIEDCLERYCLLQRVRNWAATVDKRFEERKSECWAWKCYVQHSSSVQTGTCTGWSLRGSGRVYIPQATYTDKYIQWMEIKRRIRLGVIAPTPSRQSNILRASLPLFKKRFSTNASSSHGIWGQNQMIRLSYW